MGRGEDEGEKAFREREREAEQEHRHEAELDEGHRLGPVHDRERERGEGTEPDGGDKDKDPASKRPLPRLTGLPNAPRRQSLPHARLAHDTPHDLSPCDGFATDGLTFVPQDLNAEGLRAATVKSERRCSPVDDGVPAGLLAARAGGETSGSSSRAVSPPHSRNRSPWARSRTLPRSRGGTITRARSTGNGGKWWSSRTWSARRVTRSSRSGGTRARTWRTSRTRSSRTRGRGSSS